MHHPSAILCNVYAVSLFSESLGTLPIFCGIPKQLDSLVVFILDYTRISHGRGGFGDECLDLEHFGNTLNGKGKSLCVLFFYQ